MAPCKRVYNYILNMPFVTTLDAMATPIHLKLKYHKVHDESVTICTGLSREKMIYKALQQDQKQGQFKAMEIIVAFLIMQLRDIAVKSLVGKANYSLPITAGEDFRWMLKSATTCHTNVPSGYATWLNLLYYIL